MSISTSDVTFHRAVDNSDPGFSVKGSVLRWISGGVEARRAPRFWKPLKISSMPKGVQDKIKETFGPSQDGDTIRRRDLVLSIAPVELVDKRNRDIKEQQKANEAIFRGGQRTAIHSAVKTTPETSMQVERTSSEQFK